ncbi:MAG: hypothetical protein DMF56_21710 [Acidobacteria bacterium]|nr:MAG: hypothetical protein DMF56_21710 [Acidobacteriota bacterium]
MAPEVIVALISAFGGLIAATVATLPAWFMYVRQKQQHELFLSLETADREERSSTFARYKRSFLVLLAIVAVLVLLTASAIIAYGQIVASRFDAQRTAAAQWPVLIKEARRHNRAFIVPHVTMLVTLARPAVGEKQKLIARTVYSIEPLRDIDERESVFIETYSFNPAAAQSRWFGSNREYPFFLSGGAPYEVHFQGTAARPTTVVTGVNAIVNPKTLGDTLPRMVTLPADAEIISYTNPAGAAGDYIGELLLVVDSSDFTIEPLPRLAIRWNGSDKITLTDEFFGAPLTTARGQRSVSARWQNIQPGETLAVVVRAKS